MGVGIQQCIGPPFSKLGQSPRTSTKTKTASPCFFSPPSHHKPTHLHVLPLVAGAGQVDQRVRRPAAYKATKRSISSLWASKQHAQEQDWITRQTPLTSTDSHLLLERDRFMRG